MERSFLFIALLSLTFASQAQALDITANSQNLSVTIEGPSWIEDAETSIQNGVAGHGNPVSITEFIPPNESFDSWTKLFAVMIEENIPLSLEDYTGQQVGRFLGACDMAANQVYHFDSADHYSLFIAPCGKYHASPEHGEIAIFFLTRVDDHLIKIYQHFRGPAFSAADLAAWPATQQELDSFLARIRGVRVVRR